MKFRLSFFILALCYYAILPVNAADLFVDTTEPLMLAEISFSEEPSVSKTKQKKRKAKSRSLVPRPRAIEQYEIEGYIKSQYIRAVLQVANQQSVTGNIYDQQGNGTYVYGKFMNGVLHVYDPAGKHFTIIVND